MRFCALKKRNRSRSGFFSPADCTTSPTCLMCRPPKPQQSADLKIKSLTCEYPEGLAPTMLTSKQENFAQAVASGMKAFYVYELIDPRDGYVFYIGKGKGCRIRQHARNARAGRVDNVEKYRRITAIHSAGMQVIEKIVSWHETGGQALSAERVAIAAVRAGLTNIIGGITTNEEKVSEEAKILLTKLAPVSWLKSHGKPEMRKVIEAMFGSFEAYDDFLRGALNKLIVPSKVGESREVEYG